MNNPIDTRKELAKIARVGVEKYDRTKRILNSDNEEIKNKIINGELSINKAYNTLKNKLKRGKLRIILAYLHS